MKPIVAALPSLRPRKLRLNEVTIVFAPRASLPSRRHWPMHGPHALASTVAPIARSARSCPSRSIVARVRAEPGATRNSAATRHAVRGRLAGDVRGARHVLIGRVGAAADQRGRDRVDEPERRDRRPRARAARAAARGPGSAVHDVRLERAQVELEHAVVVRIRVRLDFGVGREQRAVTPRDRRDRPRAPSRTGSRPSRVEREQRVVAPSSAPMFAIVALPVAPSARAPGPDVLDDRVRRARHRELPGDPQDHVLRRGPVVERAREHDRDPLRVEQLEREPGHRLDRVGAADADRAGAEPARVGRVRVGAQDQRARQRVVLEHHLVDDAGARLPEAGAVARGCPTQEGVDLVVLRDDARRSASASARAWIRWSQWTEVGSATRARAGLRKLEHRGLTEHVLQHDAIGSQPQRRPARRALGAVGLLEVGEQELVGERERGGTRARARASEAVMRS
jgi:hypothetical protein